MEKSCWICSGPAESSEHKFKKTDLVTLHGEGPYVKDKELLHLKDGVIRKIHGPNAGIVKYEKSLCQRCNDTFSQPFDYAYDKFIQWAIENRDIIVQRRIINFMHIYGETMEESQLNLYKYFAKSFGCRLANDGFNIPADISQLMHQESFKTGLRISFAVNEDMLSLPYDMQMGLSKGPLFGMNTDSTLPSFIWEESYKWLNVFYWYNYWPNGELGFPWVADSAFLYLGTYALLDPNWHSELIHRIGEFDKFWVEKMKENEAKNKSGSA